MASVWLVSASSGATLTVVMETEIGSMTSPALIVLAATNTCLPVLLPQLEPVHWLSLEAAKSTPATPATATTRPTMIPVYRRVVGCRMCVDLLQGRQDDRVGTF